MPTHDWIVVGAGISGCTVAERLAAGGRTVKLVDRRERIGGNCSDGLDHAGVLVHQYGPHLFHTQSDEVFAYLSNFTEWFAYEHRVLARAASGLVPMPVNTRTIELLLGAERGERALAELAREFGEGASVNVGEIRANPRVAWVGDAIWRTAYEGYSTKQWGRWLDRLDASVLSRVPVRLSADDRYFPDRHQCMPVGGYQPMFERMVLGNPRIDVVLGESARPDASQARRGVVFTGPVDEYFGFRHGRLPYRSVRMRFVTHDSAALVQPAAVVNYLGPTPRATRSTEFRHFTGQDAPATTVCWEYPFEAGEGDVPMYPIPAEQTARLYARYARDAAALRDVHFCGRLGTYRYLNMDAAVAQALELARQLT